MPINTFSAPALTYFLALAGLPGLLSSPASQLPSSSAQGPISIISLLKLPSWTHPNGSVVKAQQGEEVAVVRIAVKIHPEARLEIGRLWLVDASGNRYGTADKDYSLKFIPKEIQRSQPPPPPGVGRLLDWQAEIVVPFIVRAGSKLEVLEITAQTIAFDLRNVSQAK